MPRKLAGHIILPFIMIGILLFPKRIKAIGNLSSMASGFLSTITLHYKALRYYAYYLLSVFDLPKMCNAKFLHETFIVDESSKNIFNEIQQSSGGIAVLTAHIGAFHAIKHSQCGTRLRRALYRDVNNLLLRKFLFSYLYDKNDISVKGGSVIRELIALRKSNSAIGVLIDRRDVSSSARLVNFLGKKARISGVIPDLLQRYNIPTYFYFCIMNDKNPRQVILHVEKCDTSVENLTQHIFDVYERYIRIYPHQWMWLHDIWK